MKPASHTNTTPKITNASVLSLGRIVWITVLLISVLTYIASFPVLWEQFHTPPPNVAAGLAQIGLSEDVFALYKVGTQIIASAAYFALSVFIGLRLSRERIGLMMAIFFAALGTPLGGGAPTVSLAIGETFFPTLMYILGWSSVWLLATTFPDGRFVPRWAVIPALLGILTLPFWLLPPASPFLVFNWPSPLQILLMLVTYGSTIFAQIYRYRYFSTPIQRQQGKWAMLMFAQVGLFSPASHLLPALFPSMNQPGIPAVIYAFAQTLPVLASALIPFAMIFAVVRYRLWDVDLMINRSLVYGTAMLFLLVVFGIAMAMISQLVGQSIPGAALFLSAIVVALLFNPTRRIMQRVVDRRLYRFKYDLNELSAAQKKLEIKNPGVLTGKTLGRYEVLGVLGKGGMGEVYAGYEEGQTVALKVLPSALAERPDLIVRFEREARAMQRLLHPHIVKLLSSGIEADIRYLVLEYIEGADLSRFLKDHGEFSLADAQRVLQPLAHALDYIHSLGVIHRDIKSSNIMLQHMKLSEVMLMDFGLAKLDNDETETDEEGIIGTIDYMAPEQIMASAAVDYRVDIYALGVLAYQMLTAESPFKGSVGQIVFAHLQQPAPDPCRLKPDLPDFIGEVIQQAMAKDPNDRFDSADAFVRALSPMPDAQPVV